MIRELVCINCPMSCHLQVECNELGDVISVSGNTCARGETYARQEVTAPVRMVTSLMKVAGKKEPLSVKTAQAIPKELFFDCVKEIFAACPEAPVHCGDVVIENVCNTGVNVIATRDIL